ncbi:MAG: hypothetical protein ISR69_01950 [Gammaproteobacteria bacterium]|nr:hypothetical protein [Gammaproteobacteria bacterium]
MQTESDIKDIVKNKAQRVGNQKVLHDMQQAVNKLEQQKKDELQFSLKGLVIFLVLVVIAVFLYRYLR